jgi:hypothetical protein
MDDYNEDMSVGKTIFLILMIVGYGFALHGCLQNTPLR